MDFRVLCVGDVVGNPGLSEIQKNLRKLIHKYNGNWVFYLILERAIVVHDQLVNGCFDQ